MDNNTVYKWILNQFTIPARAEELQLLLGPHLSGLVQPGDRVLDLCCGAGGMSFWFEGQGARVTGMDNAPYMLDLARDEARLMDSAVAFVEADVHKQDFGHELYDLVSCFGNSITDFPIQDFFHLGEKVAAALKDGGRFLVQYEDGNSRYLRRDAKWEGVYQEAPERITFSFIEYNPELGATVNKIRNETLGEEYLRTGYIYSAPIVQLAMSVSLDLEKHIVLGENHYLDIFTKQDKIP